MRRESKNGRRGRCRDAAGWKKTVVRVGSAGFPICDWNKWEASERNVPVQAPLRAISMMVKDKEAPRCEMVEYDRRKGRGGTAASKGGIWQRAAGEGAAGSPLDGMTSTLKEVLKLEPSLLEARKLFSSANQCKFVKRDQWQLMGLVKRCFPCRMRLRAEGHGSFLWHLMKIRGCKKEKASVEFALL